VSLGFIVPLSVALSRRRRGEETPLPDETILAVRSVEILAAVLRLSTPELSAADAPAASSDPPIPLPNRRSPIAR
jgi:hypothetical protein